MRTGSAQHSHSHSPQGHACTYGVKGGIQGEERLGEKKRRRCSTGEKRRPRLPFSLLEAEEARYFRCFGNGNWDFKKNKLKGADGGRETAGLRCSASLATDPWALRAAVSCAR